MLQIMSSNILNGKPTIFIFNQTIYSYHPTDPHSIGIRI